MKKFPTVELLEDIAVELGVDASSYDVDDKKITFENGLQSFEKIVSLFYMAQ